MGLRCITATSSVYPCVAHSEKTPGRRSGAAGRMTNLVRRTLVAATKAQCSNWLYGRSDPLRWQRLNPFQKLASMLFKHLGRYPELLPDEGGDGIIERSTANSKRCFAAVVDTRTLRYLLLKAQRMAATRTDCRFRKAA
jgi:hypothetical protein